MEFYEICIDMIRFDANLLLILDFGYFDMSFT